MWVNLFRGPWIEAPSARWVCIIIFFEGRLLFPRKIIFFEGPTKCYLDHTRAPAPSFCWAFRCSFCFPWSAFGGRPDLWKALITTEVLRTLKCILVHFIEFVWILIGCPLHYIYNPGSSHVLTIIIIIVIVIVIIVVFITTSHYHDHNYHHYHEDA